MSETGWGKGQGEGFTGLIPCSGAWLECVFYVLIAFRFETGLGFKPKPAEHLSIHLMH